MIFDRTNDDLSSWKQEMRDYEKGKRTKKPFGQSMPHTSHVTHEEIKARENKFNPLLQTYKTKEDQRKADSMQEMNRVKSLMNHIVIVFYELQKNVQKYEKNYDIVNLYEIQGSKTSQKPFNKKLGPIRNAYNVINNQKLPDFYFKDREMQLPQQRQKNLYDYHKKEYDIITGNYKQNHEEKINKERQTEDLETMQKYWKTHNYDPVYGKFYDAEKQQKYQNQLHEEQKTHGQDFQKRLPPSYVYRQPLILDFQKALPQSLRTLDQKEYNRKKKYQMKYIVQDEYEHRNMEEEEKYEKVIKNRVHDGRLLDEKSKEFDIITNKNYPTNRTEQLYNKKPKISRWEEYIKPTDNFPSKPIKTSGFN